MNWVSKVSRFRRLLQRADSAKGKKTNELKKKLQKVIALGLQLSAT